MPDVTADSLIHTGFNVTPGWRPGPLSVSLAAALVACLISGGVIVAHVSDLPDIDDLFAPQIVQPAPVRLASADRLAVLTQAAAAPGDINIAPTPPVYVEPYAPDYDVLPVSAASDASDFTPDAPVETAALVLTRGEAQDAYGALADALAGSSSSSATPPAS
jgi:hypothetical protein